MNESDGFWNRGVFLLCACVCVAFIVLMAAAMALYPGGTPLDQTSGGYSFFDNFFSDLGMTRTPADDSNHFSFALFTMALTAVGIAIACFFTGFGTLLSRSRLNAWLRAIAGVCGAIAGASFIGVAFTPWDLYLQAHNDFVTWSFRAFLGAVVVSAVAVFNDTRVPRRFGWVFVAFAVVLFAYVLLLAYGPSVLDPLGRTIHVVGQKIIVFASVVAVLVQAIGAYLLPPRKARAA